MHCWKPAARVFIIRLSGSVTFSCAFASSPHFIDRALVRLQLRLRRTVRLQAARRANPKFYHPQNDSSNKRRSGGNRPDPLGIPSANLVLYPLPDDEGPRTPCGQVSETSRILRVRSANQVLETPRDTQSVIASINSPGG